MGGEQSNRNTETDGEKDEVRDGKLDQKRQEAIQDLYSTTGRVISCTSTHRSHVDVLNVVEMNTSVLVISLFCMEDVRLSDATDDKP